MGITEHWVRSKDGTRIHYVDNSPEDPVGLPILFSPGLSDMAEEYTEMLEFFLPRRVVVVEVRGRGLSEAPPTGYSSDRHVEDLEAVIADAGLEQLHLMTFSRGTTWGLRMTLGDPSRVRSISIGDYRAVEVGLPEGFGENMFETRFRGKPMSQRLQQHVLVNLQRESVARELWEPLGQLGLPVLVARGTAGGILDEEQVGLYEAHVPGVKIVEIPDAPHDLFRPDRLRYPREVAEFVAQVEQEL